MMMRMVMTVEVVAVAVVVVVGVGSVVVTQLQSSRQYNTPNIQRLQWQRCQY
jgi:hypothetical protein